MQECCSVICWHQHKTGSVFDWFWAFINDIWLFVAQRVRVHRLPRLQSSISRRVWDRGWCLEWWCRDPQEGPATRCPRINPCHRPSSSRQPWRGPTLHRSTYPVSDNVWKPGHAPTLGENHNGNRQKKTKTKKKKNIMLNFGNENYEKCFNSIGSLFSCE